MQNRRLPTARLTRRHRSLALAATACIGVGIVAAQAGATPGITGNENEFWALANPVPTYELSTTDPVGGVSWSLDAGPAQDVTTPFIVQFPGLADGTHTLTATDLPGGDPVPVTRTFRVDLTPPKAAVTRPMGGAQYDVGASVLAEYACEDAVACAGPVPSGAAIDTSSAGMKTFTVTATDEAGNEAISIVDYSVRAPGTATGGVSGTPSEAITLVPQPESKPVARTIPFRPRTLNAAALRPRVGLKVPTRTPLLRWTKRKDAALYNVQIYWLRGRNATKVASLFPRGGNVRVPRGRVAYGKTYIWRVWPYVKGRYTTRPLGLSYFSVKKAPAR